MMEEPKMLRRRPHYKGMPIPATVMVDADGTPDFATLDVKTAQNMGISECCALCGQKMRGSYAFVGGEGAIDVRLFVDGPMHQDCARYSFVICPHVSGSHREYRDKPKQHDGFAINVNETMGTAKRMGMIVCNAYTQREGHWIPLDIVATLWEEELRGDH